MPIQVGAGGIGAVRLGSTVIESAYLGASLVFSSAAAWTPAALFASGEQGAWYDPSDMSTLFQDDAGATPVTAADQTVGRMLDKSGNGNHATQADAARRPALRTGGGLWWLGFDGIDDWLGADGVSGVQSGLDKPVSSIYAGLATVNARGLYAWTSSASSTPLVEQFTSGSHWLLHQIRDDVALLRNSTNSFTRSPKSVISMVNNGNTLNGYQNGGSVVALNRDVGTTTVDLFTIGATRRSGTPSNWANSELYGLIITDDTITEPERTEAVAYMAVQSGVTL